MDTLTFVSKLAEALAWPLAAVALVALLRKELRSLLPLIKRIKAGPLEAEFERELKELRTSAEVELPKVQSAVAEAEANVLQKLAQINPRSAILEAWQQVEAAALRLAAKRPQGLTQAQQASPAAIIRSLSSRAAVSPEEFALFHDLRALRNQAAHTHDFIPTGEAALNYIELSARLLSSLERASGA